MKNSPSSQRAMTPNQFFFYCKPNLQTKTTLALPFLFLNSPYNIAALNNTIISLINLERPQRTRHTADPKKTVSMEKFHS